MVKEGHTVVGTLKIAKIYNEHFKVDKKRIVRIWIPTNYQKNRKEPYKVIYMFDGQNFFDAKTSFIGKEWQIDETIEEYIKDGYASAIVVGIDNSSDRNDELTPSFGYEFKEPITALDAIDITPKGESTMEYVVEKVIPFIEEKYNVGRSKEYRIIGGSSLGGLMATLGIYMYPDTFDMALAFSPAYQLYKEAIGVDDVYEKIISTLTDKKHINKSTIIFSSGGKGFEASFTPYVYKIKEDLIKRGYNSKFLYTLVNKKYNHNEVQWAHFFRQAYRKVSKKARL